MPTVFIIGGGGMVGSAAAQALALQHVVREIVLIDVADALATGQAMDITHGTGFSGGVTVRVGSYAEINEDDIVIITCGAAQKPGQSRLALLDVNTNIIKQVVRQVMAQGKPVYILMVTNPVDVLTYVALQESGLSKNRVFGSGTTLDTARLRVKLAEDLHVKPEIIQAYVVGEHGDSSVPVLSSATIGGIPLQQFPGYATPLIDTISQDIQRAAYQIIEAKRSTYYGIGQVVAHIVKALLQETDSILPVCSYVDGQYDLHDVVLGLPSLVSNKGVRVIDSFPMSIAERTLLHTSADVIQNSIHGITEDQPEVIATKV